MTFKEYIMKLSESNPEKRAVIRYGKLYPKNYGLTYRQQYNPQSLKEENKEKKGKNYNNDNYSELVPDTPKWSVLKQVDQTNTEPLFSTGQL
jgi:hypothetical protein